MRHPKKFIERLDAIVRRVEKAGLTGPWRVSDDFMRLVDMAHSGDPELLLEMVRRARNPVAAMSEQTLLYEDEALKLAKWHLKEYVRIVDYVTDYIDEFGVSPLINGEKGE